MPRIYKGNDTTLRLLIHTCTYEGTISDLKISLYTNDPSIAIEFTDRYTIDGNIVSIDIPNWAFGSMEDGVINYVAQGMIGDDTFLTNRQSNYYLKTPTNFTPIPMPEDVVLGGFTKTIVENGVFEYTPTDVDAWNKATIEVNVPDTNGSYDEGYNVGKNDGYDSGYQDGYNAGQPIKYNTISDIYGSPSDSIVQFKGLVALSFAYGSGNFILFTDHTGSILLRNHKEPLMVGDECVVTATLRRTGSSYISVLFTASVEVLSSNNYVVMPAEAVELTNVDELYMPNENGYAEMKYLYVDGKVGDRLTEDFIRLETDASSQGNIGLRGDFKDWVEKLKQGDSIRVYMFTENSTNNFDVKDIVQLGTEGGSCNLIKEEFELKGDYEQFTASDYGADGFESVTINAYEYGKQKFNEGYEECKNQGGGSCILEDKMIAPSMGDTDDNGYIVVEESEGFNGLSRVVINPSTIYNEGIEEGKNQGGGESGSCNLEDKWVTPSMSERDDNGLIVVDQSEGYDGLDRVVIDPSTIYNEGIEEGRNQGGGSADCNIQGNKTVELDGERIGIYPDEGYDGMIEVIVEAGRKAEEWREEGRWNVRDNLHSIDITENGRYSVDDQIYVESLKYNGGYHTDTISTYDINRIEVTFKADTSESINIQGQPFILGGSLYGLEDVNGTDNKCARAIQYAFGRIVGYWEGKWTEAAPTSDGEWTTITLDANGMTIKYPTSESYMEYTHDNGHTNDGGDIFPFIIGGEGIRAVGENGNYTSNLVEDTQFRGLIKEVKINTNSMGEITYIPKNWEYGVWDRKIENTGQYLSALEPTEGEVTFNGDWERKYDEGWREINVNIPTIQDSAKDYYYCPLILGDSGFGDAAKSWNANMVALNGYDGNVIEDKLYVPTSSNKNEFRTKEKARFVQSLPNDVSVLGSIEFGAGVEFIRIFETKQFTNLTDLTIGPDMNTVNFGPSTFPALRKIWCFSETDNIDVYFSMGSSFYDSGTLYLKNHSQETEWKTSLPSGWTIVLL
jgi:hypothetical protein